MSWLYVNFRLYYVSLRLCCFISLTCRFQRTASFETIGLLLFVFSLYSFVLYKAPFPLFISITSNLSFIMLEIFKRLQHQ